MNHIIKLQKENEALRAVIAGLRSEAIEALSYLSNPRKFSREPGNDVVSVREMIERFQSIGINANEDVKVG